MFVVMNVWLSDTISPTCSFLLLTLRRGISLVASQRDDDDDELALRRDRALGRHRVSDGGCNAINSASNCLPIASNHVSCLLRVSLRYKLKYMDIGLC